MSNFKFYALYGVVAYFISVYIKYIYSLILHLFPESFRTALKNNWQSLLRTSMHGNRYGFKGFVGGIWDLYSTGQ